ncbi:YigZ family protein [Salipaludibacillus agaradhaerens]|uniref:YigZ family protein n=1 Tax=Salipaludibacillus agaradhaerens TaxID=76935 RepID=UPI002151F0CE|nr:YigZ family protein [Salipaludibacillus agaradhaerens]MCR6108043.1 YigZ family protein [Salipaludibacillus agaradhaerens]MCR6120069.1 YigZ family protein [Salipaludibacillus agaradhaerens]
MLSTYFTVKNFVEHEIIIQKSRFIAHVLRVTSEEEAQAFIASIKKDHWNATHNCSCYMIGEHDLIQKANDDGEPSGTAGVPMLDVLKKQRLKDTAVVVTRYFGGIKLGAGGLIRAYSQATSEGIRAAGIVKRNLMTIYKVTVDYTLLGKVENETRASSYILRDSEYMEQVTLWIYVNAKEEANFEAWMTDLTHGKAHIKREGCAYVEEDV